MALEFFHQYLNQILVGSGVTVAGLLALIAGCKKFVKPTPKGARKRLKYLIKFLQNNMISNEGGMKSFTLQDIANITDNAELKWEDKK